MKRLLVTTLLSLPLCLFAQTTKTYDYSGFTEIEIESTFKAKIVQSDAFKVEVTCNEDLVEHLEIELEGDKLEIGIKGWKGSKSAPSVEIHLPVLTSLEVSGASEASVEQFEGKELSLETSGASSVTADLNYTKISAEISGASDLGLSGKTNKMELYLSGASNFKGKGMLVTDELLFDASGASNAHCQVDGDMYLKLSGASSLNYSGQGDILKEETSGASTINKVN